jgi:cytoskeletal protein CcmA (bactofilin family)
MAKNENSVKQTIVEDGTEIEGSVRSTRPIVVSGRLQGQVSAPLVTVMPSGAVHGQIKVKELKSQGEISGEVEADSVELSGRVSDQTSIRAKTLEVKLNQTGGDDKLQVTFGNCELHVGERVEKTMQEPALAA